MEKRYNFRIYPNQAQEAQIQKNFGCVRFVYNHFLSKRIEKYKAGERFYGYFDACKDLTALKKTPGYEWLCDADAHSLLKALKDLDNAYSDFFRRVEKGNVAPGFPKYRSKRDSRRSYTSKKAGTGTNIELGGNYIKLPKLGEVECRVSRQAEGRLLSATVMQAPSGKYYVSVLCTEVEPMPFPQTGSITGIQLGLNNLAVTSGGEKFENPRHREKAQKKIARLQRELSRKPSGSRNREKARVKLARAHERIVNQKNDAIHKMTTRLVREHDVICAREDSVTNLRSSKTPNPRMTDPAWSEIRRQLEYKCRWYGKKYVPIDKTHPTTKLCSNCGYKQESVRGYRSNWTCRQCGTKHDKAVNAAVNILEFGIRNSELGIRN